MTPEELDSSASAGDFRHERGHGHHRLDLPDHKPRHRIRKLLVLFVLVFVACLASLVAGALALAALQNFGKTGLAKNDPALSYDLSGCNVVAIDIRGCIATYAPDTSSGTASAYSCETYTDSEQVSDILLQAKDDSNIKGIMLEVDSPGGEPHAAYEIAQALTDTKKPTVSWIRGYGDSAAYWIASASKYIIAAPTSDVGSIGVTQSYTDNSVQNKENGITYNSISTGPYKDTGSPDKPLTDAEYTYLKRGLEQMFDIFVSTVATNRHLSETRVRELADGSTMLGQEALDNGLIDALGTKPDAIKYLKNQIGEEPTLCWPQYSKNN